MNPNPAIDAEETTAALDVDAIIALHPDPKGHIAFTRKPGPDQPPRFDKDGKPKLWDELFSIRVDELRSMFPAMAGWLTHDAYMGVNTFYRAAPFTSKTTGLPGVWRKEKHLQSLTACYADIDSGRPESEEPGGKLEWRQAQHEAELLADAGVIPQPSIMARSGRGVYLFWLLRDDKEPDKPPHAWPNKVELYKAVNKALNVRLRTHQLPADTAATDAARVLRVPGSIHRKANKRVGYVIQLDEHGKGFTYTLPELADFLELPALNGDLPEGTRKLARPAQYRKVKNPGSAPSRSLGNLALHALRAQDLLTIRAWRRGFLKRGMKYQDGSISQGRKFILKLYATFLRGAKEEPEAATNALREMAATMIPPYPSDNTDESIEAVIKAEYGEKNIKRWRNDKLCFLLGITPDVAKQLDLKTIRPLAVSIEADQARPLRTEMIQARREWLRLYMLKHGGRWTAQRVVNLTALSPYAWNNRMTANQDLNAIGCRIRSPGGRPKKAL